MRAMEEPEKDCNEQQLEAAQLALRAIWPVYRYEEVRVRTISTRQPWASLIIEGFRNIEIRTWHTAVDKTETIFIHAAKGPPEISIAEINEEYNVKVPEDLPLPRGVILGSVSLTACDHTRPRRSKWWNERYGTHGLRLSMPLKLYEPVPAKGQQRWFYTRLRATWELGELTSAQML